MFAGLMMIVEAFSPAGSFIFVCIATAGVVAGVVDNFTQFNFFIVSSIFIVLCLVNVLILRPFLKNIISVPGQGAADKKEDLIGAEAMVFKSIETTEAGVVKLLDFEKTLVAKTKDGAELGQGTAVRILEYDKEVAIVEALNS
jgi:membrane protein implicated in regulation of membrane protease activity